MDFVLHCTKHTAIDVFQGKKCLIKCRTFKNSILNTEQSNIITYIVKSIDKLFNLKIMKVLSYGA